MPTCQVPQLIPSMDIRKDIKIIEYSIYAHPITNYQVYIHKGIYQNKKEVAIKVYKPKTENLDHKMIHREINIYQILSAKANSNNCFLKYYGTYYESDTICMVMEYYESNLMDRITYLKENQYKLTESILSNIYSKMLCSFAEMEELGIYHGDIKPQNFLIDRD